MFECVSERATFGNCWFYFSKIIILRIEGSKINENQQKQKGKQELDARNMKTLTKRNHERDPKS